MSSEIAVADDRLRFLQPPAPVINCANGELWIAADGRADQAASGRIISASRARRGVRPEATSPNYDGPWQNLPRQQAHIRHWHEVPRLRRSARRQIASVFIFEGERFERKKLVSADDDPVLGAGARRACPRRAAGLQSLRHGSLLGKLLLVDDDVKGTGIKLPDGELKKLSRKDAHRASTSSGQPLISRAWRFRCSSRQQRPVSLRSEPRNVPSADGVFPALGPSGRRRSTGDLFQRIWASELSGILNHAIAGLQRVIRRGWRFASPSPCKEGKARWLQVREPLPAFLAERCNRSASCLVVGLDRAYTGGPRRWASP